MCNEDCFCQENSFGTLYIIVPYGSFMQGSVIIIAETDEKMKELMKPIKKEWKYGDVKFVIETKETLIISPVLMNSVLSDTLDMV